MAKQEIYMISKDGPITRDYIKDKLSICGISKGDIIMVSCRLPFLGELAKDKTLIDLSKLIINEILDLIGESGTMVVPSYSYSFCRKQEFNVNSTPSTLGVFFETFRKMEGVVRTPDPIFSVCIKGATAEFLSGGRCDDCFGVDSFFDRFHSLGTAKFLLIGLNYHYITNFHYIEQTNKVSYRFIKEFPGIIVMPDGAKFQRIQKYFVRDLEQYYDFRPFFDYLEKNDIGKIVTFGNSTMRIISDKVFFDTVSKLLREKEKYFLTPKSNGPSLKEEEIA